MKNPEMFIKVIDHAIRVAGKIRPTAAAKDAHTDSVLKVCTLLDEEGPVPQKVWTAAYRYMRNGPLVVTGDENYRMHKEANTPFYQEVAREVELRS